MDAPLRLQHHCDARAELNVLVAGLLRTLSVGFRHFIPYAPPCARTYDGQGLTRRSPLATYSQVRRHVDLSGQAVCKTVG